MQNLDSPAELIGDDLQDTEQGHFDEFASITAELEPETQNQTYEAAAPVSISGAEIILPVVSLACGVLAPNWDIKPEEQAALADCYGALMDKYFPDMAESGGVELSALLVTAAILTPRLSTPRKLEPEKPKDTKEAA
ncbi:hypothetical protein [Shewanella subflava]|uniref:Uncharacterized protein n=1 Tax=Shewanella subflava TaxID=2986476 RepID=A0ABT3ICI5_9GAMM|nr:hypothetical protein [Shewanella subflava]MCW3173755.1 hypothetical protein [Shewanella subflava]